VAAAAKLATRALVRESKHPPAPEGPLLCHDSRGREGTCSAHRLRRRVRPPAARGPRGRPRLARALPGAESCM